MCDLFEIIKKLLLIILKRMTALFFFDQKSLGFLSTIFRRKTFEDIEKDYIEKSNVISKHVILSDLIMMCLGSIVGSGIFVLLGLSIARYTGPSVVISLLLAGSLSMLVGLCYAELSSMMKISGSAYQFSYIALGEIYAWLIGWANLSENILAGATVARGWSAYFGVLVSVDFQSYPIDPIAPIILFIMGVMNLMELKYLNKFNNLIVFIKLVIIILFNGFAIFRLNTDLLTTNSFLHHEHGVIGIFKGAAILVYAFTGFDNISSMSQESVNPKRDIPLAIAISMVLVQILYMVTAIALLGLVYPISKLDTADPFETAINLMTDIEMKWFSYLITFGALVGILSVIFGTNIAQSRVLYSQATDGLLPKVFAKLHPKWQSPWVSIISTTFVQMIISSVVSLNTLASLTSMGSLCDYIVVPFCLIVIRKRYPTHERAFKLWGGPYLIPIICIVSSMFLMFMINYTAIFVFFCWMLVGLVFYIVYLKIKIE